MKTLASQYRSRARAMAAGLSLALLSAQATAAPHPLAPEHTVALINQCTAAMPRAHPWRARQLRQAMFRLRVSMSYHVAEERLSPSERRAAMAAERDSFELLFDTCRPLLT